MKVLPKSSASWKNHRHATVGISMGSTQHTGPVFESMLAWVGQNFDSCLIDLSDTLDRHNHVSGGLSEEDARALSHGAGTAWLDCHRAAIEKICPAATVVRWDRWLNHPEYGPNLARFRSAFEKQPLFRDAVMADIHDYLKRRKSTISDVSAENISHATDYLLEEISAHSILYREYPSTSVYPGKQHRCYELVRAGRVEDVPAGLQGSSHTRMIVYNFDKQPVAKLS